LRVLLPLGAFAISAALSAADALDSAREHVHLGQLEELVFDFQGKSFTGDDALAAAQILAEAGKSSLEKSDFVLALQFGQMSMRYSPTSPLALQVAASAARHLQQFGGAEEYADRWVQSSPTEVPPKLLRAEIAAEEGEWERVRVLLTGIAEQGLTADEVTRLRKLRSTARGVLAEQSQQLTVLKSLERQVQAASRAARTRHPPVAEPLPAPSAASPHVVLYGTSWCGVCMRARGWLQKHHIRFEDKDVEKDFAARDELAEKAQTAGMSIRGVPVIDVNGTLMLGFDERQLRELLL